MMDKIYVVIDKLDIYFWIIIALLIVVVFLIFFIFYMIRTRKEMELLDYEIEANRRERTRLAKMREDLRKI